MQQILSTGRVQKEVIMKISYQVKHKSMADDDTIYYMRHLIIYHLLYVIYYLSYIMKTAHQVEGKSMADNDCYGGQHFPLVAVDLASQRLGDQLQLSFGI